MIIRGKTGVLLSVPAGALMVLDDERDRGRDSVKLTLTVVMSDDVKVTVADNLTSDQAKMLVDAFQEALRNEEYEINMMNMGEPV